MTKFVAVKNLSEAHERYPNIAVDHTEYSGRQIDLAEVYFRFAGSKYGQETANKTPRFYRLFPICNDFQTHIDYLGADSHRVEHMLYTASEIVIPAIAHQESDGYMPQLNKFDQTALKLAAIIHDVGECEHPSLEENGFKIVGDVPSMHRTEDDELEEAKIRKEFFYPKLYSDIPDELLERAEEISAHNGPGLAPEMFAHLEKYGYLVTAHRAAKLAVELCNKPDRTDYQNEALDILIRLADGVRDHNYSDLLKATSKVKIIDSKLSHISSYIIFASHRIASSQPTVV